MELIALGIAVSAVSVVSPGPVSLSLVEVSINSGRRAAVAGVAGITGGDVFIASLTVALLASGSLLPAFAMTALRIGALIFQVSMGIAMIVAPNSASSRLGAVTRPGRTLFAITTLSPSTLGGWLAIVGAMPFASHAPSAAQFCLGAMLVSAAWHLIVGSFAGTIGGLLTPTIRRGLSRFGGTAMLALSAAIILAW